MPNPATTQPTRRIAGAPTSRPMTTMMISPAPARISLPVGPATAAAGWAAPSTPLPQLQHHSCGSEGGRLLQLTSHILGPQIGVPGPGSLAEIEIGSAVQSGQK